MFLFLLLSLIYKKVEIEYIKPSLLTIGTFVAIYIAIIRTRSLKTSQDQFNYIKIQDINKSIENRFQEGVKLLGSDKESVRLGGIYLLWQIVEDAANEPSQDDKNEQINRQLYEQSFSLHKQILNTLCSHVVTLTNSEEYQKKHYPSLFNENTKITGDTERPSNEIQTLLNLLGGKDISDTAKNPVRILNFRLDFNRAILIGAHCSRLDFYGASLYRCNFEKADCFEAIFESADCRYVNFKGANCSNANFKKTALDETTFSANPWIFSKANFTGSIHMIIKDICWFGLGAQSASKVPIIFIYDNGEKVELTKDTCNRFAHELSLIGLHNHFPFENYLNDDLSINALFLKNILPQNESTVASHNQP